MRNIFDRYSKSLLERAAAPHGVGEAEAEVAPAAFRIDYFFEPLSTDPPPDLSHLGLLGYLLAGPCTFEFFHETPSPEVIRRCLSKHDFFHTHVRRRVRPLRDLPHQWILSTGRPTKAIRRHGFRPDKALGPGFYSAPDGAHTHLIVLSELPPTRYTLLVRLLGSDDVFRQAQAALAALPPDSPERTLAEDLVIALIEAMTSKHGKRTKQEKELLMAVTPWYLEAKQRIQQEARDVGIRQGLEQGLHSGRVDGVARSIERSYALRFGPLPEAVSSALHTTRDMALLDRWLELAVTGTREDIVAAILAPPATPTPPAQPTPPNGKPAR